MSNPSRVKFMLGSIYLLFIVFFLDNYYLLLHLGYSEGMWDVPLHPHSSKFASGTSDMWKRQRNLGSIRLS